MKVRYFANVKNYDKRGEHCPSKWSILASNNKFLFKNIAADRNRARLSVNRCTGKTCYLTKLVAESRAARVIKQTHQSAIRFVSFVRRRSNLACTRLTLFYHQIKSHLGHK